ncbi:MAG: hypothetical protein ACLGHZ_09280, partial [Actinomycetes bacterium]
AWWPVATFVFALALITLYSTFVAPETAGRDITKIEDAHHDEDRTVGLAAAPAAGLVSVS